MRMKLMWLMMLVCCLLITCGFSACSQEQLAKADKLADTTIAVTEQGDAILNSPAVSVWVPPNWQAWIRLCGAAGVGLALAWKKFRENNKLADRIKSVNDHADEVIGKHVDLLNVMKVIVRGVEDSGDEAKVVKQNIKSRMKVSHILGDANLVVDNLK